MNIKEVEKNVNNAIDELIKLKAIEKIGDNQFRITSYGQNYLKSLEQPIIPILDENMEVIGSTYFVDNLTLYNVPDYVNMNARLGLKRINTNGNYKDGLLVFMLYDIHYPNRSYAEFISELEAYKLCLKRNRLDLANELGLEFMEEREIH